MKPIKPNSNQKKTTWHYGVLIILTLAYISLGFSMIFFPKDIPMLTIRIVGITVLIDGLVWFTSTWKEKFKNTTQN